MWCCSWLVVVVECLGKGRVFGGGKRVEGREPCSAQGVLLSTAPRTEQLGFFFFFFQGDCVAVRISWITYKLSETPCGGQRSPQSEVRMAQTLVLPHDPPTTTPTATHDQTCLLPVTAVPLDFPLCASHSHTPPLPPALNGTATAGVYFLKQEGVLKA